MKREKLLLFDTNSIIHRAFHALPPLKDSEGNPAGALYGSLLAFFKILQEINPCYVAVAFDSPGKTFRHKKYKEYKANRPKAPEELISQIKKTKEVFAKIGVKVFSKEGLEADDIVGAISYQAPQEIETVIVTGDADILQLVNEKTKVYTLKRGVKETVLYDKERVKEKYEGVGPEKIIEIKSLQGDPSDNIPGVKGVGKKTAVKLIREFKNLENLYISLEDGKCDSFSEGLKKKLLMGKKSAFLSRELAEIKKTDFLKVDFSELFFEKDNVKIKNILEELGFSSVAKRFSAENFLEKKTSHEKEKNLKFNF